MSPFKIVAGFLGGSILIYCVVGAVVGAFLWPWALNYWLVYFGKTYVVVWWQGAILGIIPALGYLCVPLAVITWILSLFLA